MFRLHACAAATENQIDLRDSFWVIAACGQHLRDRSLPNDARRLSITECNPARKKQTLGLQISSSFIRSIRPRFRQHLISDSISAACVHYVKFLIRYVPVIAGGSVQPLSSGRSCPVPRPPLPLRRQPSLAVWQSKWCWGQSGSTTIIVQLIMVRTTCDRARNKGKKGFSRQPMVIGQHH